MKKACDNCLMHEGIWYLNFIIYIYIKRRIFWEHVKFGNHFLCIYLNTKLVKLEAEKKHNGQNILIPVQWYINFLTQKLILKNANSKNISKNIFSRKNRNLKIKTLKIETLKIESLKNFLTQKLKLDSLKTCKVKTLPITCYK